MSLYIVMLVRIYLAKNGVTTLEHPLYSPDLVQVYVFLFPLLRTLLKEGEQ